MKMPEEFYYLEQTSREALTANPTGVCNINIKEAVAGNPACFIAASGTMEKKPRKLIITDWSLRTWSDAKKRILYVQLKQLISNEFSLYLWQAGSVIPLTLDNMNCLNEINVLRDITPEFPEKIVEIAIIQQKLITFASKFLLDKYWLNYLVNPETQPEFDLRISELLELDENEIDTLFNLRARAGQQGKLIFDEFSVRAMVMKESGILQKAHTVGEEYNFESALFNQALQVMPQNKRFHWVASNLKKLTLQRLHNIDTSLNTDISGIANVLNAYRSSYETIQLEPLVPNLFASLPPNRMMNLTKISINNETPLTEVAALLRAAPNVEDLSLTRYYNQQKSPAFSLSMLELGSLKKLVNVRLCHCTLGTEELHRLSQIAPNIQKLHLEKIAFQPPVNAKKPDFKNLKELSISINFSHLEGPDFNEGCLELITSITELVTELVNNNDIEIIDLSPFDIKALIARINPQKWAILKSVTCNTLEDLRLLLPIATHMENIKLLSPGELTGQLSQQNNLGQVKRLDTGDLRISTALSSSFLQYANNVEELTLCVTDNSLSPGMFPKLKRVTLNSLYMYCLKSLTNLAAAAPDIETINLQDYLSIPGITDRQVQLVNMIQSANFKKLRRIILTPQYLGNKVSLPITEHVALLHEKLPGVAVMHGHNLQQTTPGTTPPAQKPDSALSPGNALALSRYADADTKEDPNKKFVVNRTFIFDEGPEIPVNNYRLIIFTGLSVNPNPCSLEEAFTLHTSEIKPEICTNLTDCKEDIFTKDLSKIREESAGYRFARGRENFMLGDIWQIIPSLSPAETLLFYTVSPPQKGIEIGYSKETNLYYIRNRSHAGKATLDFVLKVPKKQPIPFQLLPLINKYKNDYQAGPLQIKHEKPTGKHYLEYIQTQSLGACRHRSIAFFAEMQHEQVRIVYSGCHAFIEVLIGKQYISCDLGGYNSAEIHEICPQKPQPANLKKVRETEQITLPGQPIYPQEIRYMELLKTWEDKQSVPKDFRLFLQDIANFSPERNRLLKLHSENALTAMAASLRNHCADINRPVFYIHSPDDLFIAPQLQQENSLQAVLNASYSPDNPLVLIVNFSRFKADDLAGFNRMLDTQRKIGTVDIPESTILVGLMDVSRPDYYRGSDFHSRLDRKEDCLVYESFLEQNLPVFPKYGEQAPVNGVKVYQSTNWKAHLLGHYGLQGETVVFREGMLAPILAKGKHLTIENGPWQDSEFLFFWRQAVLTGKIYCTNGVLVDASGLTLDSAEGYNWDSLREQLVVSHEPQLSSPILNPGNFHECFPHTGFDEHKKLQDNAGLISKAQESDQPKLCLHITQSLDNHSWARLLTDCQAKKVMLQVSFAPGVILPEDLQVKLPIQPQPVLSVWNKTVSAHTAVIISTDPDVTIEILKAKDTQKWIVIDITELNASDLLTRTQSVFKKGPPVHFEFTQQDSALLRELDKGNSVILKGQFSATLANSLAEFLLKRYGNKEVAKGRLILISKDGERLQYYPDISTHAVTVDEKKSLVKEPNPETIDWSKPLAVIRAEYYFPGSNDGLKTIKRAIKPLEPFNPDTSEADATAFFQARINEIMQILYKSPYVYIAGLSGVGKTTFVEEELGKEHGFNLFKGEKNLEKWARSRGDTLQVLFIDEENLSGRQWSEFAGLFYDPPGIVINGEYIELTKNHKVIFAGNPASYGDERKPSELFMTYHRAIVFDPLPLSAIYERILKPVFCDKKLMQKPTDICKPILDMYRFLCELSTTEVLISPRELQAMALMTVSYCERMPTINPSDVARHYAFELGESLVPEHARAAFIQIFGATARLIPPLSLPARKGKQDGGFTVTESRKPVIKLLNELLFLREFRRNKTATMDAQRYGGLGGVDLEGEPAAGKSVIMEYITQLHGFREIKIEPDAIPSEAPDRDKVFYRISAKMSVADKEKWLLHIFDEGSIAFIDEINSAPMMERLLNSLLMGKTLEGKRPTHPGFMIFSTKNPTTMDGRRAPSTALSRRFYNRTLSVYPGNEIRIILQKGVPLADTTLREELDYLINAFLFNVKLAETNHYSPAPTFRDVEKLANKIKLHSQAEKITLPTLPERSSAQKQGTKLIKEGINKSQEAEIIQPVPAVAAQKKRKMAGKASQNPHTLFRDNPTPQGCLKMGRGILRHYLKERMGGAEGITRCNDFLILIGKNTQLSIHLQIIALGTFLNEDISESLKGKKLASLIRDYLHPQLVRYITQDAIPKAMHIFGIANNIQLTKLQTIILERANKGEYTSLGTVTDLNILSTQLDLSTQSRHTK